MSSSLFRHEFGMEHALRLRNAKDLAHWSTSSRHGGRLHAGRLVHLRPTSGLDRDNAVRPGGEAVSLYARGFSAHALVTYADRTAGGGVVRPARRRRPYCSTSVHFTKKVYRFTPAIEGDFWYGHHYEMYPHGGYVPRRCAAVRSRCRTARSWR